MSVRDRIRSRNGLITAPAARLPRRVPPWNRTEEGPRPLVVIVARVHSGRVPSSYPPRHNRGTTQEGGQTVDARGILARRGCARNVAPRQIRPEDASPADPVVIRVYPRIVSAPSSSPSSASVFSFLRSFFPCPPFLHRLSPPVRTHAIFARDLMPPELCAPYLCTERVYTRLALATGATVKAPVPTISYTDRQAPGPRTLAPPCIRTSHIMESRGPTTILKGRAPDNGGKGREAERERKRESGRRGEARRAHARTQI